MDGNLQLFLRKTLGADVSGVDVSGVDECGVDEPTEEK